MTRFTELVGCSLPLQLAAMSRVVTPQLAAEVSNRGGLGMLAMGRSNAAAAARQVDYAPTAAIAAGLASDVPPRAVAGRDPQPALAGTHAPLILWVDAMGAKAGDRQEFSITGPDGVVVHRQQGAIADGGLSWFAYSGRRAPATGWQKGRYVGRYILRRGAAVVAEIEASGLVR